MKIVWSSLALERVEDIAQYIAEDKPAAAVQWVDELFSTVERLADFPINLYQGNEFRGCQCCTKSSVELGVHEAIHRMQKQPSALLRFCHR